MAKKPPPRKQAPPRIGERPRGDSESNSSEEPSVDALVAELGSESPESESESAPEPEPTESEPESPKKKGRQAKKKAAARRKRGKHEDTETSESEAEQVDAAEAGAEPAETVAAEPDDSDEADAGEADTDTGDETGDAGEGEGEGEGEDEAPGGVRLVDSLPIDPDDDLSEVEGEASPRLVSIVESLLFASTKPLRVKQLRKILQEPSVRQIQLALKHLMSLNEERGIILAQVAGGFVLQTSPKNATWVQTLLQAKPVRLSRPQLETLAVVAYRQPVTRPEIDHIRGVDSGAVIKLLLERELIQIVGKKDEPGRPMLFGTTVGFLEFFNLMSLRDLPDLREFRELSEETKATLRKDMPEAEVEALGQEVLRFARPDDDSETAEDSAEAVAEGVAPEGDWVDELMANVGEDQSETEEGSSEVDAEGEEQPEKADEGEPEAE